MKTFIPKVSFKEDGRVLHFATIMLVMVTEGDDTTHNMDLPDDVSISLICSYLFHQKINFYMILIFSACLRPTSWNSKLACGLPLGCAPGPRSFTFW